MNLKIRHPYRNISCGSKKKVRYCLPGDASLTLLPFSFRSRLFFEVYIKPLTLFRPDSEHLSNQTVFLGIQNNSTSY